MAELWVSSLTRSKGSLRRLRLALPSPVRSQLQQPSSSGHQAPTQSLSPRLFNQPVEVPKSAQAQILVANGTCAPPTIGLLNAFLRLKTSFSPSVQCGSEILAWCPQALPKQARTTNPLWQILWVLCAPSQSIHSARTCGSLQKSPKRSKKQASSMPCRLLGERSHLPCLQSKDEASQASQASCLH